MMSCHNIRPLLPARAEELTLFEARTRAEHVAACARCATEAAAYSRLGHGPLRHGRPGADPATAPLSASWSPSAVAAPRHRPRVLAAAAPPAPGRHRGGRRAVRHRRQTRPRPAPRHAPPPHPAPPDPHLPFPPQPGPRQVAASGRVDTTIRVETAVPC